MAMISAYNSSSISTLFSSLNNNKTTFGAFDYTGYSAIRNGSYGKLVKAYYDKNLDGSKTSKTAKADKTDKSKDSSQKVNVATVRDSASALVTAEKDLVADKLWKQKTTVKDGKTETDYDRDAIFKAVENFTKQYNSLVSAAGNSEDKSVLRSSSTMVAYTKANKNLLASVGLSIDSNNKLNVDEKKLKEANMTTVQSVFRGAGSYGKTVSSSALSSYSSAVSQLANISSASSYSNTGSYSYISGSVYDTFL